MSLNVTLLRSSFDLVVDRAPDVTHRFYERLWVLYPQTRSMFAPARQTQQENMLTQTLVLVLEHLEDPPWLETTLHDLGARHIGYGVTDEMYDWVGAALLATLADVAGDAWNPELHTAWSDAYGAIAGMMQEGARRASA